MSIKIILKGFIKIQGVGGWTEVDIDSLKRFEFDRNNNYEKIKNKDVVFGKIGTETYRRVNESRILDAKFENEKVEIENKYSNDHVNQIRIDYKKYWIERVKLSHTQKAENLTIFNFIYKIVFDGKEPTPEEKKEAIKIQTSFFKENNTRITPNPTIFRKMFPKDMPLNIWKSAGFKLIEKVIISDKVQCRYYQNVNN